MKEGNVTPPTGASTLINSHCPTFTLTRRSAFQAIAVAALLCAANSELTVAARAEDPAAIDLRIQQHLASLSTNAPPGFTVVPQRPFVVIGDESPEIVRNRATNTVKWAVDRLKREYFVRDPQDIIDIWLFRDGLSYTNHALQLFQESPASRFGYYSSRHHALVMNISTGGGTLVHEIVHPFVEANFPKCPAWFNEGLASLYEASTEKNGRIRGLVNWRLKGLEDAIQSHQVISFRQLTSLGNAGFYGSDRGYSEHYAQARYLCYYLQEKDILKKFYHDFAAHADQDPTGYATLQSVLGEADMTSFQKQWEAFIIDLRSPQ